MAIVETKFEALSTFGVQNTPTLKELTTQSKELVRSWQDSVVINGDKPQFGIDKDLMFSFRDSHGESRKMDITDTAFSQLCARLGVPAKYVKKCVSTGKTDLALENFHAWANDFRGNMLVRQSDGAARAVLSDTFSVYDSYKILRALNYTVDTKRFVPSQVHLSLDRLHIRFVDYTPLPVTDGSGKPLYAGFIVNSSDVGRGALSMTFFIYRSVCQNGMAISSGSGTLYKQAHVGERMTESKISAFNRGMMDIDRMTEQAVELIKTSAGRKLKEYEMAFFMEKARREMKLSEKGTETLKALVGDGKTYEPTKWGFINGITELAQQYTLDTRIDMEDWAGRFLTTKAA